MVTIALAFMLSSVAVHADDAADARQAEISFAKAFADRDAAKFFSFVADDAKFFSRTGMLAGKAAVVEGWSAYLKKPTPPFRWQPNRVETNGAGDLALSTGPVFDSAGTHLGNYSSIWQKQKDGSWKIIFDGPGEPACPPSNSK